MIPKQGNMAIAKLTLKGKGEQLAPHRKGNQENETPETRLQYRAKREETNDQMENHANGRGKAYTSAIGRTTPSRYEE